MKHQLTRESEMIRNARLRRGYTQQEVASFIGVHVKAYQRLEYGERDIRNASMKIGLALCAVLKIDPMFLVFGGDVRAVNKPLKK